VNGDRTREHYARLAATYDENYAYSPAFLEWITECILRRLRLGPSDVAADVGCGTGLFARGLAEHAAAVICVDPSEAMLAQVPATERLITVAAPAEDVATGRVDLPYERLDAVLLKESLHHVRDRAAVIAGLARLLRPGGRMLVVMLPKRITYPLFADALELFEQRQPDPVEVADEMRAAGLDTELTQESFSLNFPTERYLRMVRNRYMSLLSAFDDEQLEAGAAEIRAAHPEAELSFTDTFAFVLGRRHERGTESAAAAAQSGGRRSRQHRPSPGFKIGSQNRPSPLPESGKTDPRRPT
jgi:SAM-dependent methyltransferase